MVFFDLEEARSFRTEDNLEKCCSNRDSFMKHSISCRSLNENGGLGHFCGGKCCVKKQNASGQKITF